MKLLKDSLKELIDTLSDKQLENLNEYADYHFSKAEVDSEISLAKKQNIFVLQARTFSINKQYRSL